MDARRESELAPMKNRTTVERKSERELVVTRTFNGPARLVFEAWTEPRHLLRWRGPRGFEVAACDVDLRVGGRYRFVHRAPDGSQHVFSGQYREIERPSRLVSTFAYHAAPAVEGLDEQLRIVGA